MNCKHVKELLPLYVGRDLEERRERLVTAHLQSCVQCASSAAEFREARQLVQQFAPPPFSDAVYAGMRRRVWREIGRESKAPALSQVFSGLFRPRAIWAGATVMAVAVFAFYFIANRANDQRHGRRPEKAQANVLSPGKELTVPSIKENDGVPPAKAGQTSGLRKTPPETQRRKVTDIAHNRQRPSAVNSPDAQSQPARALPAGNNPAAPGAAPPRNSTTSEKTLRMEIQTSDRNIRIIWFTHQGT